MTIRHSQRLSWDSDDDYEYAFSSDDDNPGPIFAPPGPAPVLPLQLNPNATPPALLPRQFARSLAGVEGRNTRSHPQAGDTTEAPPPHPFQTDFGPETIATFLRKEVDKIKCDRATTNAKRREKQKETAAPASYGLIDDSSLALTPSAPPLDDLSNQGHASAAPLGPRRSSRLLRRDLPNQSAAQPHHFNPLASPFVPDSTQAAAHKLVDLISDDWSIRATTFEEYTKNKRTAVRNNAQETPKSPLRAKLRQTGVPDGHTLSGAATGEATNAQYSAQLTSQDGYRRAALPGSSKEHRVSVDTQPPRQAPTFSTASIPHTAITYHPGASKPSACGLSVDFSEANYKVVLPYDHAKIVPETIPQAEKKNFLDKVARARNTRSVDPEPEAPPPSSAGFRPTGRLRARKLKKKDDFLATEVKQYPRIWKTSSAPGMPTGRSSSSTGRKTPAPEPAAVWAVDENIWNVISEHLSTQDVKNLRLVCKSLAQTLAPIQFRNLVVKFDGNFFDASMFRNYGQLINQFGISFEYDLHGLAYAEAKVIESKQDAWFGTFTWPTESYPRFQKLQAIEDLVDNNRSFLKELLASITNASELGLCVDSGHGWLEGPDISDLALFDKRISKGSPVFGKTFKTEDVWTTFARNELFKWGQQNTVNATIKAILARPQQPESDAKEVRFLDALRVRDIESFRRQDEQYDYDAECHTGGPAPPVANQAAAVNVQANPQAVAVANLVNANANAGAAERRALTGARNSNRKLPQWPLIFNGHNLAAEHGGHLSLIQNKTANPNTLPLLPGMPTEAQVQWLMETVWAQRAFLVAYTTAIITHKTSFAHIRTLRISKLSSGLLSSLEQQEFWKNLFGLKKLEIYLAPDWRQEHVTGDRNFAQNMPISPAKAAERFTEFLRRYITKLENLHSLSVGYVGGGEHAVGLYARNHHVLPAPIVDNPDEWLLEHKGGRAPQVTKFDHVRELKFENCWFTPWMLKAFMAHSRDTSLHSLTLSSVSMTTIHEDGIEKPLTTFKDSLRCLHSSEGWSRESLPEAAAWARTLDAITPGKSFLEHKYEAGLVNREENPMPDRRFRGHIQQITLASCGYVKVTVPKGRSSTYSQNSAVVHSNMPTDRGLQARKARFSGLPSVANADPDGRTRERVNRMMELSEKMTRTMMAAEGFPWLGILTQCIHPIEKRVLEEAWQMKFGWGDDLSRWAAVEDGQFEGGTGRFSGVIKKDGQSVRSSTP